MMLYCIIILEEGEAPRKQLACSAATAQHSNSITQTTKKEEEDYDIALSTTTEDRHV